MMISESKRSSVSPETVVSPEPLVILVVNRTPEGELDSELVQDIEEPGAQSLGFSRFQLGDVALGDPEGFGQLDLGESVLKSGGHYRSTEILRRVDVSVHRDRLICDISDRVQRIRHS